MKRRLCFGLTLSLDSKVYLSMHLGFLWLPMCILSHSIMVMQCVHLSHTFLNRTEIWTWIFLGRDELMETILANLCLQSKQENTMYTYCFKSPCMERRHIFDGNGCFVVPPFFVSCNPVSCLLWSLTVDTKTKIPYFHFLSLLLISDGSCMQVLSPARHKLTFGIAWTRINPPR